MLHVSTQGPMYSSVPHSYSHTELQHSAETVNNGPETGTMQGTHVNRC